MSPFRDHYSLFCLNCNHTNFSQSSHNCSRYDYENHPHFSQSSHSCGNYSKNYHNYFASLIADRVNDAIERRDFALSTALLMNEGYSFDFSLIASLQLVGGAN